MQQAAITIKGQVTIPASIRKKLGLRRGDYVAFREEGGKIYIQSVQNKVEAAFGLITPSKSATIEEMDEAIKKRAGR